MYLSYFYLLVPSIFYEIIQIRWFSSKSEDYYLYVSVWICLFRLFHSSLINCSLTRSRILGSEYNKQYFLINCTFHLVSSLSLTSRLFVSFLFISILKVFDKSTFFFRMKLNFLEHRVHKKKSVLLLT